MQHRVYFGEFGVLIEACVDFMLPVRIYHEYLLQHLNPQNYS